MTCIPGIEVQDLHLAACGSRSSPAGRRRINRTRRPSPVVAEMLGMPQASHQSCINRFLHELGTVQCLGLDRISELSSIVFGSWYQLDRVDPQDVADLVQKLDR